MIADDGGDPVLHQPLAGAGHAAAAAVHRVDDPRWCATACAPASRRSTASGPRSPACWPTPFPASAWSRPSPRRSASPRASARPTASNLAVNDRINKIWSLFSPSVSLLTEIGLLVVWGFGIWQVSHNQHHGRRADGLPRLHQPLLRAARFDEPHRLRSRKTRPRPPSASSTSSTTSPACRSRPAGAPGRMCRGASRCATSAFATATATVINAASTSTIAPGEMIGLVGPQRLGQEHAGQPDLPLLRRHRRLDPHRRRRHPLAAGRRVPRATSAWCCRSRSCSSAPSPRTSPTASPDATRERDRRRGPRRARARVHPAPAAGLRLAGRRARPGPVRRRAPAHLHRARAADRPAHPDPRRGHLLGRHRDREGNPEGAGQPGARPHHHRHRAPPVARCARPTGWWCWIAARWSKRATTTS